MRARVYCSSVRSSKRRINAIMRNRRSAVSLSSRVSGGVSAALAIGKTLAVRLATVMAVPVTVPRLGEEMRSAILIQFLVPAGGAVTRGQPLYELDTDKVTQEADGVVLRIDASEGGEYEVGAVLAWIGEQGEEPPSPA